jgi:hypothetical protein
VCSHTNANGCSELHTWDTSCHSNPFPDPLAERYPNQRTDRSAHATCNGNEYTSTTDTEPHQHTNTNGHPNNDPDTDSYTNPNCRTHADDKTNAHPHSGSDLTEQRYLTQDRALSTTERSSRLKLYHLCWNSSGHQGFKPRRIPRQSGRHALLLQSD